jgi:hypothetical protein
VADAKISALTALTGPNIADGDLLAIVDISDTTMAASGTDKKTSMTDVLAYVDARNSVFNASVASVAAAFAADTYLVGSSILIPDGRLKAKTMYRCRFNVTKTGAGVAAPVITPRIGTAGTTADTARGALTFAAQTAVIDEGMFEVFTVFQTVGGGTSAVIRNVGTLVHRLSITGMSVDVSGVKTAVSAGFDSTVAGSIIGLSVNGGASAAWTIDLVQAELFNLA